MTDRIDLARVVTDWLRDEAPPHARERVLATAIARVGVTPQRRTRGAWLIGDRFRISPALRLALLGAVLALGLLGGALIAAALLREPDPPASSYEAVFLRLEEGTKPATETDSWPWADIVVIAIDAAGQERQVGRLPHGPLPFSSGVHGLFPPGGVVSPSGLLAVPSPGCSTTCVHWRILDLRRPQADPIAIPAVELSIDQLARGYAFWGPGDRLALGWHEAVRQGKPIRFSLSFVEGRTGATTAVDVPDDLEILPRWAADGSGVVVQRRRDATVRDAGPAVLRPDGTIVNATEGVTASMLGRHSRADGAEIRAAGRRVVVDRANGGSKPLLLVPAAVEVTDAAWTADGLGVWLATTRSAGGEVEVNVERWRPESDEISLVAFGAPAGEAFMPFGSQLTGWAGLAPDDSMMVIAVETADGPVPTVVMPDSGEVFAVEGSFAGWGSIARGWLSFAGWLEVDR